MALDSHKRFHMIGIKGAGMTALAELLVGAKKTVTGSDTSEVFYTDAILKRLHIVVKTPFDARHIPEHADAFIYSTAYTEENNVELRAALSTGKPVYSYPEALGLLTEERMTIAVCGTHGKTTTSALLAETLRGAGVDPSAIVGSEIRKWKGGALFGKGLYLVIEADEYQNKFEHYHPWGMLLTNVDWDHPDFFPSVAEYEAAFTRFIERLPRHGFLAVCGDHARALELSRKAVSTRLTYGFRPENDVAIVDYQSHGVVDPSLPTILQEFSVLYRGEKIGPFKLALAGRHNAENAAGVIAVALHLKLDMEGVKKTFRTFTGTKRRFEYLGVVKGALVYDDYAHHPEEIRATLAAFKESFPGKRLFVIFHPHTYTRTKALLEEFAQSFSDATAVAILDIYGSAREKQGGVTSQELVERINRYHKDLALHAPDRDALVEEIRAAASKHDIIITMGAGDVWQVAEALLKAKKR